MDAAVLVPLHRDAAGELRVVLVRRTEGGLHGGQLAFPGGKHDVGDASLRETALREACEEIGLEAASATVLAALDPIETRVTGFRIHPFLARVEPPRRWRPSAGEVAEVLEPTVAALADPANRGSSVEQFPGWPAPARIEFIRVGPHRLWGASYRILAPLLPRLTAGEWEF